MTDKKLEIILMKIVCESQKYMRRKFNEIDKTQNKN